MANPSDAADQTPPNPTDGFTEADYSIGSTKRKNRPVAIVKEDFNPPKGQNVEPIKRQTFQGTITGLVNEPTEQIRYYWVRRQDGAVGKAKRTETGTNEADFRFGDHVSLVEGPEADTWLIIGRPSPVEQAAIYGQVTREEGVTYPREASDLEEDEIEYDEPEIEGGIPEPKEDPDLEQIPFKAIETYPINDQFGGHGRLTLNDSGRITVNVGGVYDVDISIVIGTANADPDATKLKWGDVPLLTLSQAQSIQLQPFAKLLAKQYGLNVEGINEYYNPTGMSNFGGMIGVIEDARVQTLRDAWTYPEDTLKQLQTVGQAGINARVGIVAIVRYDATVEDDPLTVDVDEADPLSGLHLVVFADPRYALIDRYARNALYYDPSAGLLVDALDWQYLFESVTGTGGMDCLADVTCDPIDSVYLWPEFEMFYPGEMKLGEWLDAAAWSVGRRWIYKADGNFEVQTTTDAVDGYAANKILVEDDIIEGEYLTIIHTERRLVDIRMGVYESYGAVKWHANGQGQFFTSAANGHRAQPVNSCLWERQPIDSAQENSEELQALVEQLLLDWQVLTDDPYAFRYNEPHNYAICGRDKEYRHFIYTESQYTTVISLSVADLPGRLVTRSSIWPLMPGFAKGITRSSVSPGGSVVVDLVGTLYRNSHPVVAYHDPREGSSNIAADATVRLGYEQNAGQWIIWSE